MPLSGNDIVTAMAYAQRNPHLEMGELLRRASADGIPIPVKTLKEYSVGVPQVPGAPRGNLGTKSYGFGSPEAKDEALQLGIHDAILASGIPGSGKKAQSYVLADVRAFAASGGMSPVVPLATKQTLDHVAGLGIPWARIVEAGVPTGKGGWKITDVNKAVAIITAGAGAGAGSSRAGRGQAAVQVPRAVRGLAFQVAPFREDSDDEESAGDE